MKEKETTESEGLLFPALFSSQEKENKEREGVVSPEEEKDDVQKDEAPSAHNDDIDIPAFIRFFNTLMCHSRIPLIEKLEGQRLKALRARCREYGKNEVVRILRYAAHNSFLNGGGNKGWVANIDWLLRPSNFIKVKEGIYNDFKNEAQLRQERQRRNRDLYETVCREQRERRSRMAEGAVTYEEYQRMKAQGLIPDTPPTP